MNEKVEEATRRTAVLENVVSKENEVMFLKEVGALSRSDIWSNSWDHNQFILAIKIMQRLRDLLKNSKIKFIRTEAFESKFTDIKNRLHDSLDFEYEQLNERFLELERMHSTFLKTTSKEILQRLKSALTYPTINDPWDIEKYIECLETLVILSTFEEDFSNTPDIKKKLANFLRLI